MRRFTYHVPETLDPAAVSRPAWGAYALWVVSAVVVRRFRDHSAGADTFVPLDSRYMRLHIPDRVRRPLLDDLVRAGVLECDDRYYFGPNCPDGRGKCLCYRLGPTYRGAKIRPRPVTHRELIRKMQTAHARERAGVTDPAHLALRRWHDRVEVTPDAPRGEHVLLDVMLDGERRFSVCEQGRVHTNVANLPRQYRQFIRLGGRELASVDISTSQPLLLAILIARGVSLKRWSQQCANIAGALSGGPRLPFRPPPPSASAFLRDCLDGCVYDRIADRTGYSRDDVKPLFLAVVYGEPQHMGTKVGDAIRALYPDVFSAVAEANFRLGHGGLPRLMQRLESDVMIGRVAARLLRERPTMPLLTVHDSILVPPEFAGIADGVIGEEWHAEFGVRPRTKRSDFTAPQEPRARRRTGRRRGSTDRMVSGREHASELGQ